MEPSMTPSLQLVQPTVIRTKLARPCVPYCDRHGPDCAHGKFFGPEEDSGAATVWLFPDEMAGGETRVMHFEAMGDRGPAFTLDQAEARARSLLTAVRVGRGPRRVPRGKSRASALR